MKKCIILACIGVILACGQERNALRPNRAVHAIQGAALLPKIEVPTSYSPADVKVLGDLDYGKRSRAVFCSANPPYRAFVFSAFGGEAVDITVAGSRGKPFVALTDSTLNTLVTGNGHVSLLLPYRGPYIEVWYIVFKDFENRPQRFTVQVNKASRQPQSPMADASVH